MSSGTLVPTDFSQLPSTRVGSDMALAELAKGADFLGRLQLVTKGGYIDAGLIRPGHYGIPVSAEEIEDLGDTIDVLPLAVRPKALDMSDKEAIIVNYDMSSAAFLRIQAKAQEKESKCQYGPSFLVIERSTGRFLEYFCGNKSSRTEARKMYPFLPLSQTDIEADSEKAGQEPHGPLPMTLMSRLTKKGSYSWHVPVVHKCSMPFDKLPKMSVIVDEVNKFITARTGDVEKVEDNGKKSLAR